MERDELSAWLRLALTAQVGNATARRLLAAFGMPQAVFDQAQPALAQVVSRTQAQALGREPAGLGTQVDDTWSWLGEGETAESRRVLTLADSDYPASLLDTEDPPLMLYLMGEKFAGWPTGIAVVGSRNPTPQGLANAQQFSHSFAQAGLTVVSGLALGIDAAAHQGALEGAAAGQIATIAVIGTGLDRVYPRQHLELARRIARQGLLVSEYPLHTPALAPNFPRRNRIIAGLSRGTLVVEAALRSGSLITARQAAEQGKDVFAIPGSIHSPQSRGCHALLKQGAKLVECARDVLEDVAPGAARTATSTVDRSQPAPGESGLLKALGFEPVTLDALVARTGEAAARLQAQLLELELKGEVARLPGGLFQRVGAA
jgi:DNA processing protein